MANRLVRHVALVSDSASVGASDLMAVSAAIHKQVTRDFGPLWDVEATVDAFDKFDSVPLDYWIVWICDSIPYSAAGIHLGDEDNQPYALVKVSASWSQTVSHETLEMLADPFGNRLVAGVSVEPGQGRVRYLVEVCDPSEADHYAYTINGIRVSDFYTPRFFDPVASPGVQYSFTGAISGPRQVLEGGYLSWEDTDTGMWWQQRKFGGAEFVQLGRLSTAAGLRRPGESLREAVDRLTPSLEERRAAERDSSAAPLLGAAPLETRDTRWRRQLERIVAQNPGSS